MPGKSKVAKGKKQTQPLDLASYPTPPIRRKECLPETDQVNEGGTLCVITCHNYGRFLDQCLRSVLRQTLPFERIVVVDDSSTDFTPEVVRKYRKQGVQYVKGYWRNACEARKAGVAAVPRSRFLLFVDADNYIDRKCHEEMRKPMFDAKVGIAYGKLKLFRWPENNLRMELCKPFDYNRLRVTNFIDTCSLVRMETYMQTGGWEGIAGLQDWLLWLRATRNGWTAVNVPKAIVHYRVHGMSMTKLRQSAGKVADSTMHVECLKKGTITTVVTLFSGREWMLNRYSRFLRNLEWPKENLRIVAVDNSRNPVFHQKLRAALARTGIPFIIGKNDREAITAQKANEVCDSVKLRMRYGFEINEHLAYLYAYARELMPVGTDYVWSIEDDIEPDSDALYHIVRGFHENHKAGVICGAVLNRFGTERRMICWKGSWLDQEKLDWTEHLTHAPERETYLKVTGSGFMCTAFRRAVWDAIAFRPSPFWNRNRPYYDWAAAYEVEKLGWDWMIAGSIRPKHWQSTGEYLDSNVVQKDLPTIRK